MQITTTGIPEGSDSDLITLDEAAAITRQSIHTMRWLRQEGRGPEFFKIGRRLVTTVGELRRWIEEQKTEGQGVRR